MRNNSKSNGFKYNRVLRIYTKMMNGEIINKAKEADSFGVDQRSIQRDIDDLRAFFDERNSEGAPFREVLYSRERRGFFLRNADDETLSDSEILAVCRAVLSCRLLEPDDRKRIMTKLLQICVPVRERERYMELLVSKET